MCAHPFLSWVSPLLKTLGAPRPLSRQKSRPVRRVRLCLDLLEERVVPSVFTVNNLTDTHAVNLTTGQDANGNITLRSAIEAANNLSGTNSVILPGGNITLTLGTIPIAAGDTLTVAPSSPTVISGNNQSTAFTLAQGSTMTLSNVVIEDGRAAQGGGIFNAGNLTLSDATVTTNLAIGANGTASTTVNGGNGEGGGIFNAGSGTLTLTNTVIENNMAQGGSAASGGSGGLGLGGGLFLSSGSITVTNSTLSGNEANIGGAIAVDGGSLILTNDTLADNAVVVSGNDTSGAAVGGGLFNEGSSDSIQLTNVTVTGNTSGITNETNAGTIDVLNTIIAGNSSGDVSGTFTSSGFNLIGNASGSTGFGASGDLVGTAGNPLNPLLGTLGNYGGTTQTIPLLPGSAAINGGTGPNSRVPNTDQRGKPRVGAVDIGAFESQGFTLTIVQGNNQSADLNSAFSQPLEVQVKSNDGSPVANGGASGSVSFTVQPSSGASAMLSSDTAAIGANGLTEVNATANGVAGSYTVIATLAGVGSETFNLTNLGTAFAITPIAGNGQTAVVGNPFTKNLEVVVTNATGAPASGEQVTFTAPASGASGTFTGGADTVTVTTNANGIAVAPVFTADATPGSFTVTASVAGQTPMATFNETNVAASTATPVLIVPVGGLNQSTAVGTSFGQLLQAEVEDSSNMPIGGVSVTFMAPAIGPSGTFANGSDSVTVTTNSNGIATTPVFTADNTQGSYSVTASIPGNATVGAVAFGETNIAAGNGNPANLTIISGDNQTTPIDFGFGQRFEVQVTDSKGDALSGVSVTFTAPSSGPSGTFETTGAPTTFTAVTDSNGDATTTLFQANGVQGTYAVTATVPADNAVAPAYLVLTNTATFGITIVAGNDQNATVNTAYAQNLEVQVRDVSGHPLGNESVTFTVVQTGGAEATFPGGADSVTVTTNSNGIATASVLTANGTPGGVTVEATAPGFSSPAFFSLANNAVGGAASITVVSGNNQNTLVNTAFPQPLEVRVTDANGNALGNVSVAFQFVSGDDSFSTPSGDKTSETITTNSNGLAISDTVVAGPTPGSALATANVIGPNEFVAQTAQFTLDSFPATGSPASIAVLSGNNQTGEVNSPFPQPLTVVVKDGSGNPLGNEVVTFTAPTSGASGLFGTQTTATAVTDSNGDASVAFTANGTPGSYQVTASVAGVAGDVVFTLTNSATAVPASIVLISGNNQSTATNTIFGQPLQVEVEDANGNPVSGASVTFTAPSSGASGTFSNGLTTFTVTTDAAGIATVTGFTANGTAGTYTVTASANGVSTPVTFTLTNTAAGKVFNPSKVGTFVNGVWTLDVQGDGGTPLTTTYGLPGDMPIVGDWNGAGFDEIGVVRTLTNITLPDGHHPLEFVLNVTGTGIYTSADEVFIFGESGDHIVLGDWNGDGKTKVGVARAGANGTLVWSLDFNGNFATTDQYTVYVYGLGSDSPVVGDWNGAGKDEIGVVRPSNGTLEWVLDTNGDGTYETSDAVFFFGLPGDRLIVGDWTGSGTTKIGTVRPASNGIELAFSLDKQGNGVYQASDAAFYGLSTDEGLIGDWSGMGVDRIGVARPATTNADMLFALDFNGDGVFDSGDQAFGFGQAGGQVVVGRWRT